MDSDNREKLERGVSQLLVDLSETQAITAELQRQMAQEDDLDIDEVLVQLEEAGHRVADSRSLLDRLHHQISSSE